MNKHLKNYKIEDFNGSKSSGIRTLANESGVALITALLFMVVLIALVPAAISLTTGEMDRTGDFEENREAFFLAEAGLEHAKYLTGQSTLRLVLKGPDDLITAVTGTAADDDDNGTFGAGTLFTGPDGFVYDEVTYKGNTYYIRAWDNDDGDGDLTKDFDHMIFLSAVGIVDNTTTSVETLVYNPPGLPVAAVTTNGDTTYGGDTHVMGACGSIHANGDLTLSGSTSIIDVNATSTGTTDVGTATVNGSAISGAPEVPVPNIDVTEYKDHADYVFKSDGTIEDKNGDPVVAGPIWADWSHNMAQQKWRNGNGFAAVDAFIYVEGNVDISNIDSGNAGDKWELTLVATGFVSIGGNEHIINKKDPALPPDIQNLFIAAGTDVDLAGAVNQNIEGFVYAWEQLKLSGNADFLGALMAYNGGSAENLVSSNAISGSSQVTYSCGLFTPTTSVNLDVVSWNEL